MSVYFVTGIDTGIGKTVATGLMARFLESRKVDWISVKMVQTGNVGFSEDLDAHRAMAGRGRFPEDEEGLTAPQIFRFPSSPLLAARLEGRVVDLGLISAAVAECARRHRVVLVEGAGGLDVPLTEDKLAADFVAEQGWPAILVTCGRLGSINHTLLSLEALRTRGIPLAGVVYNYHPDADPTIDRDTPEDIRRHLRRMGLPGNLVRIPHVDSAGQWPGIDFSAIFSSDLPA